MVYVDEKQTIRYFIWALKDEEKYSFSKIEAIAENAFQASKDLKQVFFDDDLKIVKKEAFKDADELEIFCCGSETESSSETETKNTGSCIKGLNISKLPESQDSKKSFFTVETLAFADCANLHTIVFPKCTVLKIEKNVFSGCASLRTVVAPVEKIEFTENPFADCPQTLVFVGKKQGKKQTEIERFARENGYRFVNAC